MGEIIIIFDHHLCGLTVAIFVMMTTLTAITKCFFFLTSKPETLNSILNPEP